MPRKPTGRPPGRPRHPGPLTPAEERVLSHLREGLPNAEIAVRLGISPDAVKYHVSNMLGKLALENREQLAAWREPSGLRRVWLGMPVALKWAGAGVAGAAVAGIGALMVFGGNDESPEPDLPLDLYTGIITLNADGEPSNGRSWWPSMSADGRYVAFESTASDLVPGDTNGVSDIFVFDRHTREMRRISVGLNGAEADGPSYRPSISADGRFVAFDSEATNLVEGDTNHTVESIERVPAKYDVAALLLRGASDDEMYRHSMAGSDVFVAEVSSLSVERISVASDGSQGELGSYWPSISADGRFVAFQSTAQNLAGEARKSLGPSAGPLGVWGGDVYLRDRVRGETSRISVRPGDQPASWASGVPVITPDARFVAFLSRDPGLDGGEGMTGTWLYRFSRDDGSIVRVPLPDMGEPGTFHLVSRISRPAISADGTIVAFGLHAAVGQDGDLRGIFVANVSTGTVWNTGVTAISVWEAPHTAFDHHDNLLVFDLIEVPTPQRMSADGPGPKTVLEDFSAFGALEGAWGQVALSSDGAWVGGVFWTGATDDSQIAVRGYE